MAVEPETGGVRIAELVATLSYAADLGLGQPMAHCMRQTVIALRLADLVGVNDSELEATYYLGLMMNVYCHADAAEQAQWFGDDISLKGDGFEMLDMNTAQMISFILRRVASHGSGMSRARRLAAFPVAGPKQVVAFVTTHSTLGSQFAGRIGLQDDGQSRDPAGVRAMGRQGLSPSPAGAGDLPARAAGAAGQPGRGVQPPP